MDEHLQDATLELFFRDSLTLLNELGVPYLVGGTVATNAYIGTHRATKDLDIFCKAGDYPAILAAMEKRGYRTEVEDERWLAKAHSNGYFFDVVFALSNMMAPVNSEWFVEKHMRDCYGMQAPVIAPTEFFLSKAFIMDRIKYDGADVAHLILRQGEHIDWRRLLSHFEQYWEILLMHVINFRFIYPSEREKIPRWLLDELIARLGRQRLSPTPRMQVCRGRIFSRHEYQIDVEEWGFADFLRDGPKRDETTPKP